VLSSKDLGEDVINYGLSVRWIVSEQTMIKRIQDLTEEDKKKYYEATKEVYSKKYATP